jgi:hypothetical protein
MLAKQQTNGRERELKKKNKRSEVQKLPGTGLCFVTTDKETPDTKMGACLDPSSRRITSGIYL